MKAKTHRLCEVCKESFKKLNSLQKFCSANCKYKYDRDKIKFQNKNGIAIKSERIGKNLRKLTSFPGKGKDVHEHDKRPGDEISGRDCRSLQKDGKYRIPKETDKQKAINSQLAKIKANIIKEQDEICFTCGRYGNVDLSHLIPRSKRPDLTLETANVCLMCRSCHLKWESLSVFWIRQFRNLNKILEYIESVDSSRFIHISEKLYSQLNYSK